MDQNTPKTNENDLNYEEWKKNKIQREYKRSIWNAWTQTVMSFCVSLFWGAVLFYIGTPKENPLWIKIVCAFVFLFSAAVVLRNIKKIFDTHTDYYAYKQEEKRNRA